MGLSSSNIPAPFGPGAGPAPIPIGITQGNFKVPADPISDLSALANPTPVNWRDLQPPPIDPFSSFSPGLSGKVGKWSGENAMITPSPWPPRPSLPNGPSLPDGSSNLFPEPPGGFEKWDGKSFFPKSSVPPNQAPELPLAFSSPGLGSPSFVFPKESNSIPESASNLAEAAGPIPGASQTLSGMARFKSGLNNLGNVIRNNKLKTLMGLGLVGATGLGIYDSNSAHGPENPAQGLISGAGRTLPNLSGIGPGAFPGGLDLNQAALELRSLASQDPSFVKMSEYGGQNPQYQEMINNAMKFVLAKNPSLNKQQVYNQAFLNAQDESQRHTDERHKREQGA
jgi:hypothetical protein